jgi:hypothetical protein
MGNGEEFVNVTLQKQLYGGMSYQGFPCISNKEHSVLPESTRKDLMPIKAPGEYGQSVFSYFPR